MSENKTHPAVVICNTLVCCGALACLIAGIAFLVNPEGTGYEEARARLIGMILTAIGGTIIGGQILIFLCICVCGVAFITMAK